MPTDIIGSLSPWQSLHEQFLAQPPSEIFAEYDNALVQVGGLNFEDGEGTRVALTNHYFQLHVPNQYMADIHLPFTRVSKVEIDSFLNKREFNVTFDGTIPIHLKLPETSEDFLKKHIAPQHFVTGLEINSIGKLLTSGSVITAAQKKHGKRIEYDYMLVNFLSSIIPALFLCGVLLLFLGATALGMRRETFDAFWAILGGFAFFVCMIMLHFGINRGEQQHSKGLAFLRKYGKTAEATSTNVFEKEFSDSEGDPYWVSCYEYTFPANLANGKTTLIRTKLIGDRKKETISHATGHSLRIKYAPQLPALCCPENSCSWLLPLQGIGLAVFLSGLVWFGLALWSIGDLFLVSAAQNEYQLSHIADWPQIAIDVTQMLQAYPLKYIVSVLFMFLGSLSFTLYGFSLTFPPSSKKFRRSIEAVGASNV